MKVRFGLTVSMGQNAQPYEQFSKMCRAFDQDGFSAVWIGDEQSLRREMYVAMTVVALNTKKAQLNCGPTNAVSRHPAVTAGAISTLNEVSGGRAALTMSRGFSNVGNLGLKPVLMAETRDYIRAVKALWKDKITTWKGKTIRLSYPTHGPLPIYIIAEGPKTLRMAGEIADGVIVGLGQNPDVVKACFKYIREGAESAGRSIKDLDIWWHTRWNIADSYEEAVSHLGPLLASAAGHALAAGFEGKLVPEEFQPQIRRIQEAYLYEEHREGGNNPATPMVDEVPGLRDYLVKRFTLAGTVKQFIEQVEELADLGVTGFRLASGPRNQPKELKIVAEQVMPHFR